MAIWGRIAEEFTGITDLNALMHQALEVLIEQEGARRPALLGVAMPAAKNVPRLRRPRR